MPRTRNPKDNLDKIRVHLEYACFICGNILADAASCVEHVRRIHRYNIPLRKERGPRPDNDKFIYKKESDAPFTIEEYACPCCWFHSPEDDLEALNEHIREEHNPTRINLQEHQRRTYVADLMNNLNELKIIIQDLFPERRV